MSNGYLTGCALIIAILMETVLLFKKSINNNETIIFKKLLLLNMFESLTTTMIVVVALTINSHEILKILNRIDVIFIVSWCSMMYYYIFNISSGEKSKKVKKYIILLNIIIYFLAFILNVEIITENGILDSKGPLTSLGMISAIIYIVLMVVTLFNFKNKIKKEDKIKYIPLIFLILFLVIAAILRIVIPEINFISIILSFVDLLMIFTIENPDLKLLREFSEQKKYAEDSNEEKTSFLFNMSNQIKEPILAISNISGEALLENNMEEVKDDLRKIKSSSNELLQLVNDVLDISDIEKRKIGIRESKYNVYHLFEVLNKNFNKTINKKIEYRFHFDKSIPEYLYGDSIRIKQVMNILLENALEYTNEGFIEVNVNSIIKHDVCRLIITVEDSGLGMSTDEIKHLFDKEKIYSDELLKEVDDTKNNLGVLKSIVNLMNGNVLVNSEIGKGSKFTIIIDQKVKEEKTKIIETVEQYEEMYENKEKILLVINHSELSKKINKMFKKGTYEIEEVTGGQACLEKIRTNEKFDLIIMEEDLEKLSSEDTLIKLKDTSGYKIPVILISNNKGFGAKEMYQEKGFKDVLFLPLKKEEVLKQVEEYIKD